jgi:hypothetical protein
LTVYRYQFTTLRVKRNEGRWWERTLIGRSQAMTLQGMEDSKNEEVSREPLNPRT